MLELLIEKLEKLEYKLMKIKAKGSLSDGLLSQDRYRCLTNTVNILNSLVNKTIQNKHPEDDIALCHSLEGNTADEPPWPNLSGSERFLEEVKNMVKSKPASHRDIQTYLTNFQELLGDLVFSICEINNCQTRCASGIKVKDLVTIKILYSAFWELLSVCQNFSTQNNTMKAPGEPGKAFISEVDMIVPDLINIVESCLKEMSKVKLDIEHYIKFNLLEMQFSKQDSESNLKTYVTEEKVQKNEMPKYLKAREDTFDRDNINRKKDSDFFAREFPEHEDNHQSASYERPPGRAGPQENYLNSCLFTPSLGGWDNCYVEDSYSNFFNTPIIYPPDVLFFDPPTMVFQSQINPKRKNSLPKIYSVTSVKNSGNQSSMKVNGNNRSSHVPPIGNSKKKQNLFDKSLFENTDEDLFIENWDSKWSETEYVHLREKISSLFSMMKTNQIDDKDDIFDVYPQKLFKDSEEKDISSSHQPKENKKDTKIKKKKLIKQLKGRITNRTNSENQENDKKKKNNKSLMYKTKNEKHKDLLHHGGLLVDYPMKFWESNQEEVIYDRRSVIELFKQNLKESYNDDSVPTEQSTFCLWPVAAEYIYVSEGKESDTGQSVSSENAPSLGKGFEKSFYSLQMNKKYEQRQMYEGGLIELDRDMRNSNHSLCNRSTVNYAEPVSAENNDIKHLYSPYNDLQPAVRNEEMISFNNPLVPTDHVGLCARKQTYTVQYADCGESFVVNKNYKKEKIGFYNCYNESQNWDSFISILTSKVCPNTQVNERRMFRKIVKNFAGETLPGNNLFNNNVQTLTSSGGPFRLFDINGYPLTDSAGNVLKDPYGKSIVQLDSTGFPKDNIKIFDAAGNSPKDINFDPTQKPQTNFIVVKLTDNFKRALHLFDKYGRPLTDSNGKLLVNIHGRPLLRFDNFGRPNTDYRGGPLYTDNGFRWSYKMESLSKEQISNENLTSQRKKLNNELKIDMSDLEDVTMENPKFQEENYTSEHTQLSSAAYQVNSKKSDIWQQVENVLQHHSKKYQTEKRAPEINRNGNRDTVKQNSEVKEHLSSIIYHDDQGKEYTNNKDKHNLELTNNRVKNDMRNSECNAILENRFNYGANKNFLIANITQTVPKPFYNNLVVKQTASKHLVNLNFPQGILDNYIPSIFLENKNLVDICHDPRLLVCESVLTQNRPKATTGQMADATTNVPSILTLKNREYLNNLCNEILKNKMKSRDKMEINNKKEMKSLFVGKKENVTDSALSEFTSSFVSKYTHEMPLFTDSPAASTEFPQKDPQIKKLLGDIDTKFRKHENLNIPVKGRNSKNKLNKGNKDNLVFHKDDNNVDQRYEEYTTDVFHSTGTSEETNTYIDITNMGQNQYNINVKERMRTGFQPFAESDLIYKESDCVANDPNHPERENGLNKHTDNIREQQYFPQPITHTTGVYHGEFCRHYKNGSNKDSPFRFPSEEQLETTIAMNSQIEYVNEKNWLGKEKSKTNEQYCKKGTHNGFLIEHNHVPTKHEHFYPCAVKKPRWNKNRDCNLVSLLGTPVKYVLNKLDTKLSLRHQGKEKKQKPLKPIYEPYENDKKVKTLYHSSKTNKKHIASTESHNEGKRSLRKEKQGQNLLAFKSKSFSEIHPKKRCYMTYSGSQDTGDKYSPDSSSQYNKCSSDTVVMSNHRHTHSQRRNRKSELTKPKNEKYSFETHYVHTSHTTNPHHHHRRGKSPRGYKNHRPASKSPNNKIKTMKLYKKDGYSSKQRKAR